MSPEQLTVTVFGSSRPRAGDAEYQIAYELGEQLAGAGYIVCNGGYGGTMEASAKGAKAQRGTTIGVVAEPFGSTANHFTDTTIATNSHAERLMKLVELGDAYVVLKGGTGTLLELAFVWEYVNKNLMRDKPIITIGGFWDDVIHTFSNELASDELGNVARYLTMVSSPAECVAVLGQLLR